MAMSQISIMPNLRETDEYKSVLKLPEALWKIDPRPYFATGGMSKLKANLPWGERKWIKEEPDDEHKTFMNYGFEIGSLLGKGTFSNVVMAYWTQYRQNVAVKIYTKRPEFGARTIEKLLPMEIETLKSLRHPHIVAFFGAVETKHRVYLIMELVGNGNLLEYMIKNDIIPEYQARIWFAQLASAIKYAHDLEIAHRDIKLENILLDMSNNVRLTDFGFATPGNEWSEEIPNSEWPKVEGLRGSKGYMSVELICRDPYNPLLADVWAMGVVLYCMLFGKFPVKEFTPEELTQMAMNFEVPEEPRISCACEDLLLDIFQFEDNRIRSADILSSYWFASSSCKESVDLGNYGSLALAEVSDLKEREGMAAEPMDLKEVRQNKRRLEEAARAYFEKLRGKRGYANLVPDGSEEEEGSEGEEEEEDEEEYEKKPTDEDETSRQVPQEIGQDNQNL